MGWVEGVAGGPMDGVEPRDAQSDLMHPSLADQNGPCRSQSRNRGCILFRSLAIGDLEHSIGPMTRVCQRKHLLRSAVIQCCQSCHVFCELHDSCLREPSTEVACPAKDDVASSKHLPLCPCHAGHFSHMAQSIDLIDLQGTSTAGMGPAMLILITCKRGWQIQRALLRVRQLAARESSLAALPRERVSAVCELAGGCSI